MAARPTDLDDLQVTERELWQDGPPHELFKELRGEVPGALDGADQRVPRRGRVLVGHQGR